MRADRLLSMLLLLQTRGKLTAATLADELAVSRRTILRDVEALSLAGVPIYAEGGHGGGIALDEGYRTRLTGLHTPEVQALFVAHNQALLRDVGLNEASEQLLLKLLAALPAAHRPTVDHIRQRLLVDPTWWWHDAATPSFWDDLQHAVYEDRRIHITYEHYDGSIVARTLDPYSLVNKASLWYLVGQRDGAFRTYRVARLHHLTLLDDHFQRDPTFELATYWAANLQSFVERFSDYRCTLRVHPDRSAFLKWLVPGRVRALPPRADDTWLHVEVLFDAPALAQMLVFGLGTDCEVLAPIELRAAVLDQARALVASLA